MEKYEKQLQTAGKGAKMMAVKDGWLACPNCLQNRRLLRIHPETRAENLTVFCRKCKAEMEVNIDKGQCYLSRS